MICTKGVACNVEEYIGGFVFSMEVLGQMNMTNTLSQRISKTEFQAVADVELQIPNASGVYFIKIQADGQAETVKVIKR